ncbi:MAG: hypothetical protein SW019_21860, partial [Actinomycetota bacterium]|nr:hypothetical protein [Actinomycetota bacterium]
APPPPAAALPPKPDEDLTLAAEEAAAHAKATVATASDVSGPPAHSTEGDVPVKPIAAALITGLLAILAVAWVARRGGD